MRSCGGVPLGRRRLPEPCLAGPAQPRWFKVAAVEVVNIVG
jgi:hypothetical protein